MEPDNDQEVLPSGSLTAEQMCSLLDELLGPLDQDDDQPEERAFRRIRDAPQFLLHPIYQPRQSKRVTRRPYASLRRSRVRLWFEVALVTSSRR